MKKLLSVLLLAAMLTASLAAVSCTNEETSSTTTAGVAATSAPVTTKAPVATVDPTQEETDDPNEVVENPLLDADVIEMMESKTCVNDKIEMESLVSDITNFFSDGAYDHLFDGVYTAEDWAEIAEGDTTVGKCGFNAAAGNFFFALSEKVKLSAYVIYTGNDNAQYTGRIPIEWTLYGSNTAFEADGSTDPSTDDNWVALDYVYDGNVPDADFTPVGYEIDADKQGEYQYYCWSLTYSGGAVQMNEMLFYVD